MSHTGTGMWTLTNCLSTVVCFSLCAGLRWTHMISYTHSLQLISLNHVPQSNRSFDSDVIQCVSCTEYVHLLATICEQLCARLLHCLFCRLFIFYRLFTLCLLASSGANVIRWLQWKSSLLCSVVYFSYIAYILRIAFACYQLAIGRNLALTRMVDAFRCERCII